MPLDTTIEMIESSSTHKSACKSKAPTIEVWNRIENEFEWKSVELSIHPFTQWSPKGISLVFLSSDIESSTKELRRHLLDTFSLPSLFWTEVALEASGFFGCQNNLNESDKSPYLNTWSRFLIKQLEYDAVGAKAADANYHWDKIAFYTHWAPSQSNTVFCFDIPPAMKTRMWNSLLLPENETSLDSPYSLHLLMVGEVVHLFDVSVWSLRHLVRNIEKTRDISTPPKFDYPRLHDLARHIIHSSETLLIAIKAISSIILSCEEAAQQNPSLFLVKESINIKNCLRFQVSMLHAVKSRSTALEERLRNEINLAFHTVAQYDSVVNISIGKAAQNDSAAMRTIAILTLVFLPGTFISSVFSMSFFNFTPADDLEPARWTVSPHFWIYWAVTIPVTALTVVVWLLWHRTLPGKMASN